jgi:hypothetical protein
MHGTFIRAQQPINHLLGKKQMPDSPDWKPHVWL